MRRKRNYALVAALVVLAAAVTWVVRSRHRAELASEVAWLAGSRVYDVVPVAYRQPGAEITFDGEWDLAEAKREMRSDKLDVGGLTWRRVRMPNTIQHALFEVGAVPNPWYSDNWKKLQWIAERDWYLRRRFRIPEEWSGHQIRLTFDGMDYLGAVWLDGKFLGIHEGMLGGPTFDVSRTAGPGQEHELVVRLVHEKRPGAMLGGGGVGMNAAVMKPCAVDGCWSIWGNKFRSIGLWRSVRLVSSGVAYLEAPYVRTDNLAVNVAHLWAQVMIVNTGSTPFECAVEARIVDLTGGGVVWKNGTKRTCPAGTSFWEGKIELKNPRLWWPNGLGAQPLYRLEFSLLNNGSQLDAISSRFGVRNIEMVRNPFLPDKPRSNLGQPAWLSDLTLLRGKPQPNRWGRADIGPADNLVDDDAQYNSDESYRYLFEVNGRPFYVKGVCWLTSDDLLTLSPQREQWMIQAARASGINLFRLNGANDLFETEQFYNLCDENGILVWQELPFTWTTAQEIPLSVWREQLKRSILRIRQHPALAVYVGGNEFMPYQEFLAPYLGIARELMAAYDNRPFRMSSPGGSDYHAYGTPTMGFDALWGGDPNWYVKLYDEGANFISEWSYWAYANMSLFKRIAPSQELGAGPVGLDAKKFLAAHPTIHDHTDLGEVDSLIQLVHNKASWYGDLAKADLAQFVEYSQMAQADVYGYVFEHWRSQFPYKGGEALWTYNSHAPASYWNYIDWFGQPQMAYYSTKRADEPVHVMANVHSLTWAPGDTFQASVYSVNDGTQEIQGARIAARILDGKMKPLVVKDWVVSVPPNGVRSEIREVTLPIPPETPPSYLFLELTLTSASGQRLSRGAYWIRVVNLPTDPTARSKQLAGPDLLVSSGPWLKPQIEGTPTEISAEVVACGRVGPEARLELVLRNTGANPAYPVRLAIVPEVYSTIWSDNYFWLDPGESVKLQATIRVDMAGLDPLLNPKVAEVSDLALEVSAWNARGKTLSLKKP